VQTLIAAGFARTLEEVVYEAAKILFYPVLIVALACLVWVLIELGYFLYEVYLRFRYRDLEALEARTLKARDAFDRGQPRRAYRYLEENNYSVVVAHFLFDLIRNYQTQRLPQKPLKLLQEYEFYTVKRLERTRILVRIGPLLGLMGTLIPLAPALQALADGDTQKLADNLTIAFSITVLGLLIGLLGFVISIVRDRFYSQDISDLEYLLELLEGRAEPLRIGKARRRKDDVELYDYDLSDEEETVVIPPEGDGAAAAAASPAGEAGPPMPFVPPVPIVPGFETPAEGALAATPGDAADRDGEAAPAGGEPAVATPAATEPTADGPGT